MYTANKILNNQPDTCKLMKHEHLIGMLMTTNHRYDPFWL